MPYELLNKKFRAAQKQLDREVSHVQAAALELEKGLTGERVGAADITRLLGGMVEKLQVLKRKVCSFLDLVEIKPAEYHSDFFYKGDYRFVILLYYILNSQNYG